MLKKIFRSSKLSNDDMELFEQFKTSAEAFKQFTDYISAGRSLPALHLVKQNNISYYRQKFGYSVLVETGTFLGDTVYAQKSFFKEIFSIELSKDLFDKAKHRFRQDSNVTIINGDSGNVISELIRKITEPAVFWLDGHYSEGITAKGNKNTPIVEEIEAILSSSLPHGILIDDARLFTGMDDYPTIDEICALVLSKDPKRYVTVSDDIIGIFQRTGFN